MAPQTKEEEEEEEEFSENVAHHPPAPPSQLFDITTTVDPSYIISLIRKLIPHGGRTQHDSQGVNNHRDSIHGSDSRGNESGEAHIVMDCDRFVHQKLTDELGEMLSHQSVDKKAYTDILIVDNEMNPEFVKRKINEVFHDDSEQPGVSLPEEPWEEHGCILWDLAANKTHAEFMEICLGILGNLACHEVPRNAIASSNGLIETIVNQLFLDDSLCLSATCWLLTLGLQGSGSDTWAEELLSENVLCRILWIAGNTLNSQLLEKCLELLSTIVESQQVAPILLPPLMKLGLLSLLFNLLACEMSNVTDGKGLERCSVLDSILCVIESLSISSDYSQALSSNKELFRLVCGLIKLPDKIEVAGSCVTAVVLIANILTDDLNLVSEISQDLSFLQGLLDILPLVSDDSQARSALWSVLARVLTQVEENAMGESTLQQYTSVLVEKSGIIEEDLDDHVGEDSGEDHKSPGETTNAKTTSLKRIANILDCWVNARGDVLEKDTEGEEGANVDGRVQRLLSYCRKYIM
ncbi:uncharacterized protein LOC131253163 isoform X2 [Magnolia sinica]|uniref:uncharacterized protein LOC131253163 isoform X2 n=1 Tax=Magnolia sinica TaxID=86752 RepID=UPI002657D12C|nr:uncharacterized protein LOC131253163 isoform X2 [Magnolia sinica]